MDNNYIIIVVIIIIVIATYYYKMQAKENMAVLGPVPNENVPKGLTCGQLPLHTPNNSPCGSGNHAIASHNVNVPHGYFIRGERYIKQCPCSGNDECMCHSGCLNCRCHTGSDILNDNNECPCGCRIGCSCGFDCTSCSCKDGKMPSINSPNMMDKWAMEYKKGANNTCGDLLWHYTSPKMILQDNGLNCCNFKRGIKYNGPSGILNSTASQYGFDNGLISDNFPVPNINECSGHAMSASMTDGIAPMNCDCVSKKVDESSKCDC